MACARCIQASARRRQAALRSPWAEQRLGSPASLHCSRKQFPKPAAVKLFPKLVVRKVRCSFGLPSMMAARARVQWDCQRRAGFLLAYMHNAITNMLATHIGTTLSRVKQ